MIDLTNNGPAYIKAMLMGLVLECPLSGNPKDCQLHDRRKLPLMERIEWVKSLSDDECHHFYKVHCDCLNNKEKRGVSWN